LIYFDGAGLGRSGSGGTFLGDVDIFGTLTVDTINEHTLNAGVTIEGVILENGGITIPTLTATRVPFAGVGGLLEDDADMTFITDTLTVTNVDITNTLTVDTINEYTADAGVTVEGVLMENSAFTINSENQAGEILEPVTLPIGDGHMIRVRYTGFAPDRCVQWIYDLTNTTWHGVELL